MNTYVKLKTVLHIIDLVMSDCEIKHKGKAIRKRLKELPGEDVEKVVRCKDCERYNKPRLKYCSLTSCYMHFDDFCSYGVREEGARKQ